MALLYAAVKASALGPHFEGLSSWIPLAAGLHDKFTYLDFSEPMP